MRRKADSVGAMVGLLSLGAVAITTALPAVAPAEVTSHSAIGSMSKYREGNICPCMASSFFASFLDGQRQLLTCTNDTPAATFVRLVEVNIDLVVLFGSPRQLYCGWQPVGNYTSFLPISAAQFDVCRRLMMRAAANQRIPCPPESLTPW